MLDVTTLQRNLASGKNVVDKTTHNFKMDQKEIKEQNY